jgi:Flp pilus assembly pilin Flp
MKKQEEKRMKKTMKDFLREEDGMGTVEVILIIVVLIGLVIIFKTQLTQIVNDIFEKIASQSSSI